VDSDDWIKKAQEELCLAKWDAYITKMKKEILGEEEEE